MSPLLPDDGVPFKACIPIKAYPSYPPKSYPQAKAKATATTTGLPDYPFKAPPQFCPTKAPPSTSTTTTTTPKTQAGQAGQHALVGQVFAKFAVAPKTMPKPAAQ